MHLYVIEKWMAAHDLRLLLAPCSAYLVPSFRGLTSSAQPSLASSLILLMGVVDLKARMCFAL